MSKLSRLLSKEIKQQTSETQPIPWVAFYKVSFETFPCLSTCVDFSRSIRMFAYFTIEMIGNETGSLVKFVVLSRKLISKCET